MRKGDLRYRILENLDIQTLEFRGQSSEGFVFHCDKSNEVILWEQAVNQLYISYRMVLTDCEELLRNKIDKVHGKMREQNIKLDPLDTPSIIYVTDLAFKNNLVHLPKVIYRYTTEGFYIDSYPTLSSACTILFGRKNTVSSNISRAVKNNIKAYGYRWSYEKKNKL